MWNFCKGGNNRIIFFIYRERMELERLPRCCARIIFQNNESRKHTVERNQCFRMFIPIETLSAIVCIDWNSSWSTTVPLKIVNTQINLYRFSKIRQIGL